MADKKSKKIDFQKQIRLYILRSISLDAQFIKHFNTRPNFVAKVIDAGGGRSKSVQWYLEEPNKLLIPVNKSAVADHIVSCCDKFWDKLNLTERQSWQILGQVEADLKDESHPERQDILISEDIKLIKFKDEDCFALRELPFNRPVGIYTDFLQQTEDGTKYIGVDWRQADLNSYWTNLAKRMTDYNNDTGTSKSMEMLVMCLTKVFITEKPMKEVPYIYGKADAGKTSLVMDFCKLYGLDRCAVSQNLNRITHEYYVAELDGKRIIHTDEAPKGESMVEALKDLTGGKEYLTGRSPAEKTKTFINKTSLWVTSNHAPLIGSDDAIIARYRIIEIEPIPIGQRDSNEERRYRGLQQDLEKVLDIGYALYLFNGKSIPQTASEVVQELKTNELQKAIYLLEQEYIYDPGSVISLGEIDAFAQRHRINSERIKDALESLTPEICDAKRMVKRRKANVNTPNGKKRREFWCNIRNVRPSDNYTALKEAEDSRKR